jgi:glycosyltransferase involved in cell wall biosynthesis
MKILFINQWMHHKNMHSLLSYKNIELVIIHNIEEINNYDLNNFDCIYSPSIPIDVLKYPNIKFVFGPHFSVFPDNKLSIINSPNVNYIILSEWNKKIWESNNIYNKIKYIDIPFGVDTNKFCETIPFQQRDKIFIYYKSRKPQELEFIINFLKKNGYLYKIFGYHQRYEENYYLEYLQQSKFGIWIGRHESQGFALEEALSCNVPLLVWNVSSMNQEYGQNYNDIPATSIPYWDNRCGEYFYNQNELQEKFNTFLNNLENYQPRKYVLENLSIDVCEKKFIDMINKLK